MFCHPLGSTKNKSHRSDYSTVQPGKTPCTRRDLYFLRKASRSHTGSHHNALNESREALRSSECRPAARCTLNCSSTTPTRPLHAAWTHGRGQEDSRSAPHPGPPELERPSLLPLRRRNHCQRQLEDSEFTCRRERAGLAPPQAQYYYYCHASAPPPAAGHIRRGKATQRAPELGCGPCLPQRRPAEPSPAPKRRAWHPWPRRAPGTAAAGR